MRLDPDIKPIKYSISLNIDIGKLEYLGYEEISIKFNRPKDRIIINSKDIKISKVKFDNLFVDFRQVGDDLLEINLKKKYSGEGKLYISFKGKIRNDLIGFYISNGEDKILTTQFEPTYARYFIPCFDEPIFKARFQLKVSVDKNYDVISNTDIESEDINNNIKTVKFKETPLMSTYLLYLGVGKFDYLEDKYNNKKIRVVADGGKAKDGEFALNFLKEVLKYYEKYSTIDYPLKKLDLIAVPDFAAGAMENWGAITFRETALLYNDKLYSNSQKVRTMEIIAHELWHQWSGNLVTMKWWDDLWLNESFATYMAYKAIDELYKDEDVSKGRFYLLEKYNAKFADGIIFTHPIKVKVEKEKEIESIFDDISYGKGASILNMIDSFIGYDNFRLAVINYLNKYKYYNASAEDLFKEFELISGRDIKSMIERWINKAGYPIIEVNYNRDIISLNQSRFVFNRKENSKWIVPIFLDIQDENINTLFNRGRGRIILKREPDYFSINRDGIGFYVSNYNNMNYIINGLKNNKFSYLTRGNILYDEYLLNLFDKVKINKLLDLLDYFKDEDNWFVLNIIYNILYSINIHFNLETKSFLKRYEDIFNKLSNIEPNNYSSLIKKYLYYNYYSQIRDYSIIEDSLSKFKSWDKIDNNDRLIISEVVGTHGGISEFKKFLEHYQKTTNPEEKNIILRGLTSFRRGSLILDLLDKTVDGTIRLQDWRTVFSYLTKNPESRFILYEWFKDNIGEIKKYEKAYMIIRDIFYSFFNIYTGDISREIKDYIIKQFPTYKNEILKYYSYSEIYTNWIKKNKDIIYNII
ncbi:leucyl aminopeptidase [Nanobdella aerobiophila]|uniref:Aminopeptidase n=1 Tax=Nanobdella aerobiophila TaxID=2586965 RepID=A0A915SEZ4_9ARCH|nr:M1 family metallopeptidase [Nanobdella aerobiophila]BBL45360.1 leucyl aminopeptidase [Nanobdella aerobiophila]